ncbi:KIT ligand [Homo sapiens]|uniref:KIT ligand n=1 Tax=Homo sapiens TaxID=9606 RepID=A0A2R8Y515_HUMAN|nr:KIT ligand [Homo sapiens]KAI4067516.1 KIT ligand [Homo sapiens]
MKKTQVSRARPGAPRLSRKNRARCPGEAGAPWDLQLGRAGLCLPGETRGCGGGRRGV